MVTRLLLDLHRSHGMALVIISHDPWLIAQCPRRILLLDGRATEDAAPPAMALA